MKIETYELLKNFEQIGQSPNLQGLGIFSEFELTASYLDAHLFLLYRKGTLYLVARFDIELCMIIVFEKSTYALSAEEIQMIESNTGFQRTRH